MKPKKRLLCIINTINRGGAENFIMNIFRNLDKDKYSIDFCSISENENFYENEIKNLGGKIYYIQPKSKNILKSLFQIYKIVKNEKYRYVLRISQHSLGSLDLLAAKFAGAKILIQRSSNSNSGSKFYDFIHKLFLFLPMTIPNLKIAPSDLAGQYTFGKRFPNKKNCYIINNALDLDKFKFALDTRRKIRDEFAIIDEVLIGHVGRFNFQKNHSFIIETFNYYHKFLNSNSKLILVGRGELINEVKMRVKEFSLENSVIFTGERLDVEKLMMAMDVFLFPSYFEGMPNVLIEAQSTSLPCIVSNKITKQSQISRYIKFLSIDMNDYKLWSETIQNTIKNSRRSSYNEEFIEKKYDIKYETKRFIELVFEDSDKGV